MNTKTTYNLLSLVWHPNSSERIHVGLFMNDGNRVLFQFNPNRLEAASKILSPDDFRLVKTALQDLKSHFATKKQVSAIQLASEWSPEKMSYLNRYSTNLIQVEESTSIDLELSESNFKKLFEKYLGIAQNHKSAQEADLEKRVHKIIKKELKSRTSLDLKLNSDILPGLLYPVSVPSIGKNEIPFVCEIFNFEKRVDSVRQKIGDVLNLQQAFHTNGMSEAKFFAIGNEPPKTDKASHKIWKDLHDSKWIEIVPEVEIEKVVNYTKEHDVQPWA
jgi:hypothetical protein